jgi:uncharacterized protein (TIGR02996 family)
VTPPISEHEPFLRAIIEAPDDDAVRLVYSDWLEEHGEAEQARYLRAAIELENLPRRSKKRAALEETIKDLESAHSQKWLYGIGLKSWMHVGFHRGLLNDIQLTPSEFFHDDAGWFERAPIRRLNICGLHGDSIDGDGLKRLAKLPRLRRLHSLLLWYCQGNLPWEALFLSPNLASLDTLSLASCMLDDETVELLAASPHLRNVVRLDVSFQCFGVRGARALVESKNFQRLECLVVREHDEPPQDVIAELSRRFADVLVYDWRPLPWTE